MARPPKFTRKQVQLAALQIVDDQGLPALSMRSLARALDTGAMTLYGYVALREDLDVLLVDAVMSEIEISASKSWQGDVRTIARNVWQALHAHPGVIPLILTRRSRAPSALRVAEALLNALARSGRRKLDLLFAFRAVTSLIMGMAQNDLAGPLAVRPGDSKKATISRILALPATQYPHLLAIARVTARSSAQAEFDAALDLLLAGLARWRG